MSEPCQLSEEDYKKGLRAVIMDGVMSHLMTVLTGGVFLVGMGLKLGASNFQIGLLAAVPALTQLIQLPAIYLVEKIRKRRWITVTAALVSRFAWLFVALIPFLFSASLGLGLLIGCLFFHFMVGGIASCSWHSWMRDFVPEHQMGSFFSNRLRIATMLGVVFSFLAGFFIDWWKVRFPEFELYGYSFLFALGFVVGLLGVVFLRKIPDVPMALDRRKFLDVLSRPLKDKNFRKLLIFLGSWSFAINLAAPFFTVYMLKRIGLGMSMVVGLSILSQIFNFSFLTLWGKWTDHYSNKSVLQVSCPLFMVCVLAWTFTTMPEAHFLTFPLIVLIHAIMGIAMAGIAIASGNIGLKLAPKGQATAYLAAGTLVNSIAAGIAPILGGSFADFFAVCNLSLNVKWSSPNKVFIFDTININHWDFFFIFSFVVGLYSLHRLSLIDEHGEVGEKVVLKELVESIKSPIRSMSSIAGVFEVLSYPFSFIVKRNPLKK